MNKQEFIKKVVENGAWCTENYTGEKDRYVKISKVRELIDLLEEPQKPVVPQFMAEWIEYAKKNGDSLKDAFSPKYLYGFEYNEANNWIHVNQETFARAWLDGYEVEKDPLYTVSLPVHNEQMLAYDLAIEKYVLVDENFDDVFGTLRFELTEKEIKSADENYWPFAEPAEEVAEG